MAHLPPPPFFTPEDSLLYLDRLDKWFWPFTCRCRRKHGWTLDIVRGMYVCEICRLPSGFSVQYGASQIARECMWCGNLFVVWNMHKNADACIDCGGDNAAEKGKRTIDPMKEDLDV